MPKTPQDQGRQYERDFAEKLGGKVVVGSGNQWFAKLDVGDRTILWSLKHTGKDFLRVTRKILGEAITEATKIGSKGAIPGVAVDIAGEDFVILRADDFVALFEDGQYAVPMTSSRQKMARAKIPEALRHAMEEEDVDNG